MQEGFRMFFWEERYGLAVLPVEDILKDALLGRRLRRVRAASICGPGSCNCRHSIIDRGDSCGSVTLYEHYVR